MIPFPRRQLSSLRELATQVLERRGVDGAPATLARDLLTGFSEVCRRSGQDAVVAALAPAEGEEPPHEAALAAMLGDRAKFDRGGPRSTMPAQLADCLIAAAGLELVDLEDRSVTLGDDVRRDVRAALAAVVEPDVVAAALRPAIIASARARCEERHWKAFDKMVAQLDERGVRLPAQPKVPLDAVRATQDALLAARTEILERVARAAIERAAPILTRDRPDLAARLDAPVTHELTPREIAVRRAVEVAVPSPEQVVRALFDALTELLDLAWTAPVAPTRAYAVNQRYAAGDLIEHPKFGVGTVKTASAKAVEVEFPDGTKTLLHGR